MFNSGNRLRVCLTTLVASSLLCLLLVSSVTAGKPAPPPPVKYTMTLVSLPQFTSVNGSGDVVGSVESAICEGWGWVSWAPDYADVVYLDELLGTAQIEAGWTIVDGIDINDQRQITGLFQYLTRDPEDGVERNHTCLYTPGQGFVALPEQAYGMNWSSPNAINDRGQVSGAIGNDRTGFYSLFVWTPQTNSLEILDTGCAPRVGRINDVGQVAYIGRLSNGDDHAFRYTPGDPAQYLDLRALGAVTGSAPQSYAYAINNLGQVVGDSTSKTGLRAFRYTDGIGMINLGVLTKGVVTSSGARSVNDAGQVVGWSSYQDAATRKFFYQPMLYTDRTGILALWPLITNPPTGIFTESDMGQSSYRMKIFNPIGGKSFGEIVGWAKGQMYILTPDR